MYRGSSHEPKLRVSRDQLSDIRHQASNVAVQSKTAVATLEDLEVFQRAYRISLDLHRASLAFPTIEQHGLADQIRRASKSICGNIDEGFGKRRRSTAEFKRYLLMAIGSADDAGLAAVLLGSGIC